MAVCRNETTLGIGSPLRASNAVEPQNGSVYLHTSVTSPYFRFTKNRKIHRRHVPTLREIAKEGGKVLFVGTKKQAAEAIEQKPSARVITMCHKRWLGGTLTNFKTIRKSIRHLTRALNAWKKMEPSNVFPKKSSA